MEPGTPQAAPAARILIVDDEPAVRESLSSSLEFEGYRVAEAAGQQPDDDRRRKLGCKPETPAQPRHITLSPLLHLGLGRASRLRTGNSRLQIGRYRRPGCGAVFVTRFAHRVPSYRPGTKEIYALKVARNIVLTLLGVKRAKSGSSL